MIAEWLIAFLLGLLSSTHCLGMCGGIAGTLSCSLTPEVRQRPLWLLSFQLAYNSGRISSYALIGTIAGFSSVLLQHFSPTSSVVMSLVGALFLLALGCYIAGWFPRLARLEHIGQPLWRLLEPFARQLIPVQSRLRAYIFGLVWGWLPCGLVYSAALYSLTTGNALQSALFMIWFGIGTLPMLLTVGLMASRLTLFLRLPATRKWAGLLIIALAPMPFILVHFGSR